MPKLQTYEQHKFGQTNILPFVGATKISDEGIIHVESEEHARKLEELEIGFLIISENVKEGNTSNAPEANVTDPKETSDPLKKIEENGLKKTEDDDLSGSENDEKVEKEGTNDTLSTVTSDELAQLDTMNIASLKGLAKPFPFSEWGRLNKQDLLTYLKGKLNS